MVGAAASSSSSALSLLTTATTQTLPVLPPLCHAATLARPLQRTKRLLPLLVLLLQMLPDALATSILSSLGTADGYVVRFASGSLVDNYPTGTLRKRHCREVVPAGPFFGIPSTQCLGRPRWASEILVPLTHLAWINLRIMCKRLAGGLLTVNT